MPKVFDYIKDAAFNFLFADLCCFCKRERRTKHCGELCRSCYSRLKFTEEPYCTVCGKPFFTREDESHKCGECIKNKKHYDKARSVFLYDDIVRSKIIEYKFLRNMTLGKIFAEYLYDYITLELRGGYDTIIPVPLHKKRLRERYFNQALFLIDEEMFDLPQNALRKHTDASATAPLTRNQFDVKENGKEITVDKYSLKRIKYTTPQARLNNLERVKNVKGAFAVENDYNIAGKMILLVDDIYTTGSTVNECALVLKNAGALGVDVLTLAKTAVS